MTSPETVAIDLGGTKLRLAASGSAEWEQKAVPPSRLPAVLKHVWKKRGWTEVGRLIVGSKGIWTLAERAHLRAQLKGLAGIVTVMSDVELALHGAFAPFSRPAHRIMIAAGTGSLALGLTEKGRLVRAGGLGPPKGDEGSGWWIGREFLRRRRRTGKNKSAGRLSVRQIAGLAKYVIARADTDELCSMIVHDAQYHLAQLVMHASYRMKTRSPILLSWGGTLMENEVFRNGVLQDLQQVLFYRYRFVPPEGSPARTAAAHPERIPLKTPRAIPPRGP